ncbi:hypothetical protein K2173_013899 [Erythroxylum novogranatense]|uniref:Uncharacterized protein n=1 Tax=Erythroxylum novogranatense TaxID=1862640 RepID=A0AAV8SD60_9ROSI|nr:hypothetical protein K2173_013899 [Erythroxylum novogranatense]
MESTEVKKRGRGRPRKRRREEEDINKGLSSFIKKQVIELTWKPLVGRYVLKEFVGNGIFLGKIVSYDTGLYRVDYEDGDCEDLEGGELRQLLLGDDDFDDDLTVRRKKLDEFLWKKSAQKKELEKKTEDLKNEVDGVEGGITGVNEGVQGESGADSFSGSLEDVQDRDLGQEVETSFVPRPHLPPSSGNVGVPEEYVTHLFSVYAFLRSFNIHLFLSPFTLDELVGAINCCIKNSLLDSIHVALMRALRRHLEIMSSEGSELGSRCLRCIDWSLLDSFTWPAYLIYYFTIMGYVKGSEWEGFYDLLKREYYSLPVGRKLMILQILCDDVLESSELQAEIGTREEVEFGIDPDTVFMDIPENGPRTVHPRYSKTSACKDQEAMAIIAENHGTKSSSSKYGGFSAGVPDVGIDGNSDECRLCGMDGTLICCDGCPSAYHSRCIGVSKMHIPEGPWYCPECTINNMEPSITNGTSLRGADMFGVDLYQQVFLGTCNHLLVVRSSGSKELSVRYYNQKDIPQVLQALSASIHYRLAYMDMVKAIADYWQVPQTAFLPLKHEGHNISLVREHGKFVDFPSLCNGSHSIPEAMKAENGPCIKGNNANNVPATFPAMSMGSSNQAESLCILGNNDMMKLHSKEEPSNSVNQQNNPSDVAHQSIVNRSNDVKPEKYKSADSDGTHIEHLDDTCIPGILSSQNNNDIHAGFRRSDRNLANYCLYMGISFKPYAYINHYMHGNFAASAAAYLAVLSTEESRGSEASKSGSVKKVASDISLQLKAFSSVASRFFWPTSERKLTEVPRERCGWCHSCKLSASNKRGCMLNAAASNATKGAIKILSGLRPNVNGEASFTSISTYILYMGEILSGLTVGPFRNVSYVEQWRKRVEGASTCAAIKGPLLELEQNMRSIAVSGDWVKAVDDWLVESSGTQAAGNIVATTQKRGPCGKRQKKEYVISDISHDNNEKCFVWWRGGKLSELVFHRAILPQSALKTAARQGGSRKIAGLQYTDDSEIPRRSRQLVWRAEVERSKNASQLALQVRYLDLYVRWSDLVCPEQNLQDGKGPESEVSFFRNANICDKKLEGYKIKYGVIFEGQKHVPSRIMKNIIEIEQTKDGKNKYWFYEAHVPLYLIKVFEEKREVVVLPLAKKSTNKLSEFQKRQLKASRRDIFLYLVRKRDKQEKCSCASCQHDVLLRITVKCSDCQGYCHPNCTLSSTTHVKNKSEHLITCKQCYSAKTIGHYKSSNESPTSPLPLPMQECQNEVTAMKGAKARVHSHLGPVRTQKCRSGNKQIASASSLQTKRTKSFNLGLIFKKNDEDTGVDFRRKNILFRGSSAGTPSCVMCKKPYNSNLMYIHCETCDHWYHAEAVELEESRLSDVVGFKCCRCRHVKRPRKCPYADDTDGEKPEGQKSQKKTLKQGHIEVESYSEAITESMECTPYAPMFSVNEDFIQDDDPLLFSLSKVEQIDEQNSEVDFEWSNTGQGPQKLPVRRHGKRQADAEGISNNIIYHDEPTGSIETSNIMISREDLSCIGWNVSTNGLQDGTLIDYEGMSYEDMEFEPQTYFSFTELLAPDDEGQLEGLEASNVLRNGENHYRAVSLDGSAEQNMMVTSSGQPESTISSKSNFDTTPCRICSHAEPPPNLFCEICRLVIHNHCSPWGEYLPPEGCWKCGDCREWR